MCAAEISTSTLLCMAPHFASESASSWGALVRCLSQENIRSASVWKCRFPTLYTSAPPLTTAADQTRPSILPDVAEGGGGDGGVATPRLLTTPKSSSRTPTAYAPASVITLQITQTIPPLTTRGQCPSGDPWFRWCHMRVRVFRGS